MHAIVAILLAAGLLAGCGENADEPEGRRSISFARAGGLTGEGFRLEIRPDGRARLEFNRGLEGDRIEFELSERRVDRLVEHLARFDVAALDPGASEECADCFGYELRFGDKEASADSSTVTEEFLEAADPLEALLRQRLPGDVRY